MHRGFDLILRAAIFLAAVDLAVVDAWYQTLRSAGVTGGGLRPSYLTALFALAAAAAFGAAVLPGLRLRVSLATGAGTVALVWGFLGGFSIGLFMLPAVPLTLWPTVIEAAFGEPWGRHVFAWAGIAVLIALAMSVGALWLP